MPANAKLLLIGPLPPPIGGVRVLFKQLVTDLSSRDDITFKLINLPAQPGLSFADLWANFSIFARILWRLPQVDVVSLHPTRRATLPLGFVVWFLSRLFRKKCMMRKFGGVFPEDYERLPRIGQWLVRKTILNMDCLMFETKAQVAYFSQLTRTPIIWYPNSRPLPRVASSAETSANPLKFIYLGHVKRTKGILEIVEAVAQIGMPLQVDIYGPIKDAELQDMAALPGVNYKGIIPAEEVPATLQAYDVLLLPTYHDGEGYPGVIMEAYGNGLPVITTQWNAIPEIVSEESGILIPPQDAGALREAMLKLINHPDEYARLRQGAAKQAAMFSSEHWTNVFVEQVKALASD